MIGLDQRGDLGGDSTWPSSKIIPKKCNNYQFPVENTHPSTLDVNRTLTQVHQSKCMIQRHNEVGNKLIHDKIQESWHFKRAPFQV